MKREILPLQKINHKTYKTQVRYIPNWIEKFFRKEYVKDFYSETGNIWRSQPFGKMASDNLERILKNKFALLELFDNLPKEGKSVNWFNEE